MKLREWNAHLHGLVVFRALLNDPVVAKLLDLTDRMEAGCSSYGPVCDAVAAFEAALFEYTTNWGSYLSNAVLEAETICVRQAAAGQLDALLQSALDSELQFLQQLCGLTLDELFQTAYSEQAQRPELAFLPRWQTCELDLAAAYAQRMSEVGKKGYGMFAKHHVFTVENGQLVPVKYPDPQRLSELPGYEKEREKVIANTKALLAGMPANNVLLYGDAGTGKSSAVKAIANEFAPEGLRLVEVKKNQLYQIPDLMDKLAANPLKFILFIDDLSFTANDDNFAALKAILEGSVGGRAQNIAVYATSNRRHLIKETLSDRTGDDIHEADTRQELMSLSARFGLTVTFQRPEKARFETILEQLAKQHNIQMPTEQLLLKAEAFALRAGGRSPRVAKQFIEQCEPVCRSKCTSFKRYQKRDTKASADAPVSRFSCLIFRSVPHGDALDLQLCALGDGCHLHAAAGGERLGKGLGVLCVHCGKIVDIGQKDHRLDHVVHGKPRLGQNRLQVSKALGGLLLHGIGHGAGGGVYRDLPGNKHHVAQIQCLTVRADGGRCVGGRYDFHSIFSPLYYIKFRTNSLFSSDRARRGGNFP